MSNPESPSSGRLGESRAPFAVLSAAGVAALAALVLLTASGVKLSAQPSATPVLDWLFDDPVKATARVGNTLFVGGSFSKVVPQTGRVGRIRPDDRGAVAVRAHAAGCERGGPHRA